MQHTAGNDSQYFSTKGCKGADTGRSGRNVWKDETGGINRKQQKKIVDVLLRKATLKKTGHINQHDQSLTAKTE